MTILLLAAYLLTSTFLPPTNPSIVYELSVGRYNYVDPAWVLATVLLFPMLATLWLLLLAPAAGGANPHWRLPASVIAIIGVLGLWLAASGTSLLTPIFARASAMHVLALAAALASAMPLWPLHARRPLMWLAAITAVAAVSYNVDLWLFGRFVDLVSRPASSTWTIHAARHGHHRAAVEAMAVRVLSSSGRRNPTMSAMSCSRTTSRILQALAFYSFFRSDAIRCCSVDVRRASGSPSNARPSIARWPKRTTISTGSS